MIEKLTELYLGTAAPVSGGGSSGGAVESVNGKTGAVTLTKADVGLGNVDNTSDANKPISTATQAALTAIEGELETLDNDLGELGTQVAEIQTTVNAIPSTYATKSEIPAATSDLTNDSGFITSAALSGYAQTSSLAAVATSGSYADLTNKPVIPAAHSFQMFNGVPETLALTGEWANISIPQTDKIPTTNADFTTDGTGITVAKAGVIHIKNIIVLADFLGSNIDLSFAVNGTPTTTAQVFEHEAGIYTMTSDFYANVNVNDILTLIVKEPLDQTETLTFAGMTVFIEYL